MNRLMKRLRLSLIFGLILALICMVGTSVNAGPDPGDCEGQPLTIADIVSAFHAYYSCDSLLTESCVALIDCNLDGETLNLADLVCIQRAFLGECHQILPGDITPVPWPFDCWAEDPYADTVEARLINQPGQITLILNAAVDIRGLYVSMLVDGDITFGEPTGPDPEWPVTLVDCSGSARLYAIDDSFEGTGIQPGEFAEVTIPYSGSGTVAINSIEAADPGASPLAVQILESVTPGDVSNDGATNIVDVTRTIDYVFRSGPAVAMLLGDVNHDCSINVLDVTKLIDYVFRSGGYPHVGCNE